MKFNAPRILNDPIAVWFSCFTQSSHPTRALSSGDENWGVGGTTALISLHVRV
jgi:hypothetical protein